MKKEPDPISIPAYARRRKKSVSAVRKWVDQGKLKGATKRIGGRTFIEPKKADALLKQRATRDPPAKKKKSRPRAAPKKKAKAKTGPKVKRSPTFREKMEEVAGTGFEDLTLTEARAINERWKARLAEIQVKEKEGTLIPADETLRAVGDIHRVVRDAIIHIPARTAPMLAGIPATDIERRLNEEITTILEDLSNAILERFSNGEDRASDRGVAST